MPLISVIVPCYNQAQYLDECLQSVLDQTYTDWECIIVNDGSPDNIEDIAKKWVEKDSRFKYLHKENGGLSSARNAGIEIATGEWILPLDADDKIGDQYLELAEKEFEKYDLIYSRLQLFGSLDKELHVRNFSVDELLFFNPFFCSCFYLKKNWQEIGGYDETMKKGMEDWEFWIRMVYNNPSTIKVKKIDYLGFFYRRKTTSMNTIINDNKQIQNEIKNYIVTKHASLYSSKIDFVNKLILDKNRIEKHYQKYNNLFSKNFIGKILYGIANKINHYAGRD